MNITKKIIGVLGCVLMFAVGGLQGKSLTIPAQAADVTLKNPRIVPDAGMKAGQKVTWDCIWFGSYPQAEVIPSGVEYTALDASLRQDEIGRASCRERVSA